MTNLYVLSEIYYGYSIGFLDLLTVISIFLGIFIIVTKNPIISVLFFILLSYFYWYKIHRYFLFISICWSSINFISFYINVNKY